MYKKVPLLITLVAVGLQLMGQVSIQQTELSRFDLLKIDGKNAVNGLFHTYSRPAEWKKKHWLTAGGIVLGTAGLFLVDEPLNKAFVRRRDFVPRLIDDMAFYFGKPQYNYGITAGVYLLGLATKKESIRETGILLITAATASGLIQTFSKTVAGRARPSTNVGNTTFDPFNSTPDYHSFPSGHTVLAVTTMYAIGKQIKNPWLKGGAYALGMITPISRLWSNAHWMSDVGLSAVISIVIVDTVEKFLGNTGSYNTATREKAISWQIYGKGTQLGFTGTF